MPLLLLVPLSSLLLLLGWLAVEVDGRDVAGRRAPMGLVTWRRRGQLTGVVVDASVDGAGVVDVAWSIPQHKGRGKEVVMDRGRRQRGVWLNGRGRECPHPSTRGEGQEGDGSWPASMWRVVERAWS